MTTAVRTVTKAVYRRRDNGHFVSQKFAAKNKSATRKQFVKVPVR